MRFSAFDRRNAFGDAQNDGKFKNSASMFWQTKRSFRFSNSSICLRRSTRSGKRMERDERLRSIFVCFWFSMAFLSWKIFLMLCRNVLFDILISCGCGQIILIIVARPVQSFLHTGIRHTINNQKSRSYDHIGRSALQSQCVDDYSTVICRQGRQGYRGSRQ